MNKKIKKVIIGELFFGLILSCLTAIVYYIMYSFKNNTSIAFDFANILLVVHQGLSDSFFTKLLILANIISLLIVIYIVFFYEPKSKIRATGMQRVTDKILIPIAAGNGQYGRSHFLSIEELNRVAEIECFKYNKKNNPPKGGVVIGIKEVDCVPPKNSYENIMVISADRHVLLVGSTRSGKSRRIYLESICMSILAGENILVTDPKFELCAYTGAFAKSMGYQEICIDLREPAKGSHHNFLQEIIDALEQGDVAEAIDLTWDLVSVLVGEAKGEPIWHNGECASIAATILIIVTEAPKEFQNLTNVYYFLAHMAKTDETGEMPITRYFNDLPDEHPARGVFAMADIAHSKTRGSFFSSALGTLKHFTNPKIAEMTSKTDYTFDQIANTKSIVYIVLPDEKATLYSIGSMYIMQHYIYNVKAAQKNGGRCPIDWWYYLDEFGQLPYIPPIPQFLSVGAGRGMRFTLGVQDFQQIKKKYKDDYNTIKNNCDVWIYLKCSNEETLKEFSDKCGNYTVQVNSSNYSDKMNKEDGNHGASLTGRKLLLPEEVGMIEAPYSLVRIAGNYPIMMISPDLTYYYFNQMLGLGDEDFNKKVIMDRNNAREVRPIQEVKLWKKWKDFELVDSYEYEKDYSDEDSDKISFLD